MTYRQYVTEQAQLRDDPQMQAEVARWYGSGEITSAGAPSTRDILNRMPAESARWYGGFTDWRNRPSNDILPDENYGSAAAYQRTFEEVNYETNQEYWERFPNNPTQPINPRQYSAVNRLRKRRALELIASRAPQTLENYPSLRSALANTDLTEDDARRLINVAEMDQAFIEFTNTGSQIRQKNILLSMNPVQRAAFFDFSQGKIEEFMLAAAEDPSWAESAWNGFFGYVVEPLFNTLLWLNEKAQQTFRANMYAFKDNRARGLLGLAPGFGVAINAAQYWDEVAPGTYDIEGLASAREKYGTDVVNTILDLEEMRRDGLPDAIGRWEEKYAGTENEWIVRGLVYKAEENQELLDAANEINTYDLGNTGMLTLSMFGVENRNMFGYSGAANAINIAATFLLDPTIIGSKALGAYRAARYSLVKFAGPGGIEEVFKYRRTQNFFNLLGRDLERLKRLDAGKAALARETIRRQYGRYMPPEVIDEMARYGVRNADEAKTYFVEWDTAERILAGQQGRTATNWFERFYAYSDGQRRIPLTPGMSTGGILRNRTRRLLSVANPVNRRFDLLLRKQLGDVAEDGTFVLGDLDPQYVAQQLNTVLVPKLDDAGNQLVDAKGVPQFQLADTSLANVTGVKARLEILGDTSRAYGYTYRDKTISARIDRLQRRGARLPMPDAVYLVDGRDAGKIYEFARAFLPRYHATFIADAFRNAPNAAVRKQIFTGLVKTAGAAKGVHLQRGKNAEQALMDLLPETKRGGVYSPTLRMRQTPEGVFVVDDGKPIVEKVSNPAPEPVPAWEGGPVLYHGTSRPIGRFLPSEEPTEFPVQGFGGAQKFARFEEGVIGANQNDNLYGGIFYSTVNRDVGSSYKKKKGPRRIDVSDEQGRSYGTMYNVSQEPRLYTVRWTGETAPRFLDLDAPAPQSLRDYASSARRYDEMGFADDDDFVAKLNELLADPNATGAQILDHIRDGATAFDNIQDVWVQLADDGWDGYKHIGGRKAGKGKVEHDVYIFFDETKIAIERADDVVEEVVNQPSLTDVFNIVDQRPSNFDGQEFALHLWQAADYAALPRYDLFEEAGVKAAIFNDLFGSTFNNVYAKSIVDAWSLGNLVGPRYAVRNAVEDWTMYAATGGSILGAYRGRRAAMAIREARGPYSGDASAAPGVQGGKRQRLGMVASRLRRGEQSVDFDVAPQTILDARKMAKEAAKRGEDLDPRIRALSDMSTWHMIKPYFTEADRAAAAQALRDGDVEKMQVLIATVIARSRFTSLTPAQQKDIVDLASEHTFRLTDEVGESAMYENSGLYPGFALADEDPSPIVLSGTDDVVESKIVYQIGEFKDVALSGDNPLKFTFWHRGIVGSANRDGIIGKIAIGNLDKSDDEIIPIIAEAIRSDTRYGYKEKLAAFYQKNISEEEFARRYLEDVRNLFHGPRDAQGRMGELNEDLWRKIVTVDDDGRRIVTALDEAGDPIISSADLIAIPVERRPSAVLGRDVSTNIPTATNVKAFDKVWRWMGEQNARISREPIFMANYLEQRKLLRPYEQMLTKEFGEEVARKRVSQMATSRAHEFSLSYMDNPRVRTILAWNVRNVARYYRATEDFARRFMRLGTKYPEGIWKIGLTYDVLDETGFVYTDGRGEKYFVFPGSAMTMQALNWGMSGLGQNMLSFDAASYEMIGKVRMTTPSADPKQWLPTASSPLAAIAVKPILDRVPALKSFEQAILGEYSENSTLWESILPAAALRVMRLMDSNERYSMYASTYKDAIQVATAADKMPGPADPEEEWEQFEQGMNTLVTTMLFTKSVFGFFALAAPQIRANDVTQFAREKGRLNMDEGFRSMIDKNKDEPNPFAAALVDWASTYGLNAVPYSMSSSESGNKYGGLAGLTSVAAVEEGEKWVKQNPDLIKNYKTGSAWLLPRSGTFSQDMWNWLEQTGFKQPKSYRDAFEEAKTVIGRFVFLNEREYADNIILDLQNSYMDAVQSGNQDAIDSAWESLKDAENRRTNAAKLIRKDFPELDFANIEIGSGDRVRALNNEIRPMLNYMFNERAEPPREGEPAWNMQEAILTFDMYMSRIDSIQGTTDAADMDKRMLRFELSQILNDFGERDDNTRFFVDSILLPLANPTSRYGDLSLSLEEARQ